jgi:hypothetical protein
MKKSTTKKTLSAGHWSKKWGWRVAATKSRPMGQSLLEFDEGRNGVLPDFVTGF